jgi:hypothetical protein
MANLSGLSALNITAAHIACVHAEFLSGDTSSYCNNNSSCAVVGHNFQERAHTFRDHAKEHYL